MPQAAQVARGVSTAQVVCRVREPVNEVECEGSRLEMLRQSLKPEIEGVAVW